jgi:hypothetical protein
MAAARGVVPDNVKGGTVPPSVSTRNSEPRGICAAADHAEARIARVVRIVRLRFAIATLAMFTSGTELVNASGR